MDYEKAYKDALEKARFLRQQAAAGGNPLMANRYEQIFPELAESEDEKTRKEIKDFILYKAGYLLGEETEHRFIKYLEKQKEFLDDNSKTSESEDDRKRKNCIHFLELQKKYHADTSEIDECIDYIEKQKINTEGDFGRGYNCGYEACLNSHGAEWFEKQKEQKPVEPTCKTCVFYENDCPFTRGKFMPYPNKVCKDYTYSDMKVQHSEPFSCGHENGYSEKPNTKWSEDEKTAREIKEFILYKAGHLLDEATEHRFIAYLEKQKVNTDGDFARGYDCGYEKAEQDIISLIESRIAEILGDAQPAPVLRAELRELIDKIREKSK